MSIKTNTIALPLTALIVLAGCTKQAESTQQAGVEFTVERLFTVDGCTVHRFHDGGYARYFTNCKGSVSWERPCGKACKQPESVDGGQP